MRAQRGFTLVEILIAVAILGLGIAGIVALFPATIQTASRAVEDTYTASIADSVVAALSGARREHKIFRALPGPAPVTRPTKYLIFDHDGVLDALTVPTPGPAITGSSYYAANHMKDYVVLLPRAQAAKNTDPNLEPTIFFPIPPNTDRSPTGIAGGIADEVQLRPTTEGKLTLWVRRTYPLGRYREGTTTGAFTTGDIRIEFLPAGTTSPNSTAMIDQYPQYSFAFSLRRAKKLDYSNVYSSNLYECHVLIYRNFDGSAATQASIAAGGPIPRTNVPVHEFVTMIDIGPKGEVANTGPLIGGQPLNLPTGGGAPPAPPAGDPSEANPLEEW